MIKIQILVKSILLILLTIGFVITSNAMDTQAVKCHVTLFGGNQTIYYGVLLKAPMKQVAEELKGRKILTTLSTEKQKVYEVHECVLHEKKFKGTKARYIESAMEL